MLETSFDPNIQQVVATLFEKLPEDGLEMLLESVARNKENISQFSFEFVKSILWLFSNNHDGVVEEYIV